MVECTPDAEPLERFFAEPQTLDQAVCVMQAYPIVLTVLMAAAIAPILAFMVARWQGGLDRRNKRKEILAALRAEINSSLKKLRKTVEAEEKRKVVSKIEKQISEITDFQPHLVIGETKKPAFEKFMQELPYLRPKQFETVVEFYEIDRSLDEVSRNIISNEWKRLSVERRLNLFGYWTRLRHETLKSGNLAFLAVRYGPFRWFCFIDMPRWLYRIYGTEPLILRFIAFLQIHHRRKNRGNLEAVSKHGDLSHNSGGGTANAFVMKQALRDRLGHLRRRKL